MADILYRLGHVAVRRRRAVIAFWVVALIGVVLLNGALAGKTTDTLSIPGTESQQAFDLLNARFPAQSGSTAQLVFAAPPGQNLTSGANTTALTRALHASYPSVPVFPSMSAGASDSMWFRSLHIPSYGVSPLFIKDSDRFSHGLNERIPTDDIRPSIGYLLSLFTDLSK